MITSLDAQMLLHSPTCVAQLQNKHPGMDTQKETHRNWTLGQSDLGTDTQNGHLEMDTQEWTSGKRHLEMDTPKTHPLSTMTPV